MGTTKTDLPIKLFVTAEAWHDWLEQNHTSSTGIWLRFYKKGQGQSINYALALDEALCYGWIDSQVAKHDDKSYLQKFTPRRAKSMWSKRNIQYVARLTEAGRMQAAGIAQVEAAQADGRWEQAYDSASNMQIPDDFLTELAKNPTAEEFYKTLNKANLYAIGWRLQTAKTEATRNRRMQTIITMLENKTKFH